MCKCETTVEVFFVVLFAEAFFMHTQRKNGVDLVYTLEDGATEQTQPTHQATKGSDPADAPISAGAPRRPMGASRSNIRSKLLLQPFCKLAQKGRQQLQFMVSSKKGSGSHG